MKVQKYQLKNGMKVLLQESHKSPVVSIQVWVRTGSADESKGEEGISHFIEHLVFKGTKSFKMGEIASMIEGSGGELNAYTSFDQTVFYVTISKNFIDIGLRALSEMMGFPLFDAQEVENEREVVVEEIKRGQDSLGRVAGQLLFSTAYKKHPYRIPVIGYEENVRGWSAKKIKKYYSERYTPQNMFLVVTGDFQSKEMKAKIKDCFGVFRKNKLKLKKRTPEPIQKAPRIKVESSKFEQSLSYLAWKAPPMKHKDIPALEVLSLILGNGDSSKLVNKMRIESAIVNSVGASLFTTKDLGLMACSMSYADENFEMAAKTLLEVIKEVLQGNIRDEELRKAITMLESDNYYGIETVDGLSRKLGDAEFFMKDPMFFEKYLKQIRKVSIKDLVRVVRKYFHPQSLTITSLVKIKTKEIEKFWSEWIISYGEMYHQTVKKKPQFLKSSKSDKAKKSVAKSARKLRPDLQIFTLKSGTRVIVKESEGGVISAKSTFIGGTRIEPKELEGLAELSGRCWTGGTENMTEQEIYQVSESLASSLGTTVGRNSYGLSLDAIKPFENESRDLFLEVLTRPLYSKDVIEREKTVQKEQVKTRKDSPAQLASRAFLAAMFSDHPYSRDQLGSLESLDKIQAANIAKYWQSLAQSKNLTICLSGPVETEKWLEKIEKVTAHLPAGKKIENSFPFKRPARDIFTFQETKKEQSHLIVGYPGLTLTDPERYTLQIIQSILAGQGGRLFLELRDKKSLAYSVSPMRMEGVDAGYFGAYIGCSPEKVLKANEMIHAEFQKLCENLVSEQELERAQKYLVGRHDIDLQQVSTIAASILYDDIYGIPTDETFHLKDKLFAVTPAMIQSLALKIFRQKHVTSLVGPNNPFQ